MYFKTLSQNLISNFNFQIQGVKSEDLGGTTFTANDIEKLKRMYGCDDGKFCIVLIFFPQMSRDFYNFSYVGSGSSTPGPSTTTPSTETVKIHIPLALIDKTATG